MPGGNGGPHAGQEVLRRQACLEPVRELDGIQLSYATDDGTRFNIYETQYAGQAGHTIAQRHVDDIASAVRELEERGVAFEIYDLPDTHWDGEIASMPRMGSAAWSRDSEGNIMCLDQPE